MSNTIIQNQEIDVWLEKFGQKKVILPGKDLNQLLENTTHFDPPTVNGLLKPDSLEDLKQILETCNKSKSPIYTYSCGLNWGLGSKLPTAEGCTLVELSSLNSIIEINEHFHYAIVEPGVTQGQLAAAIEEKGYKLMLNVTGSAPHTSVLGNMLERGSGFMAHRINDLRGMEVMLADGSLIKSGFWNLDESQREIHHFPYCIGPDWKGLFSQSNLGIVTKAVINLYPKKEIQKMVWCKINQLQLPEFVESISDLYQRGYLHSVVHIGNDKRMKIEHGNQTPGTVWTAMAMIQGSKSFIDFLEKEIPAFLYSHCQTMGFYSQDESEKQGLGQIFGCHIGKPTDYFVRAMYQSEGATLDRTDLQIDLGKYGMLCCLPILPAKADDIAGAINILDSIDRDFGIIPAATLNPMNDLHLESVINIYFDRTDPEAVSKAHAANKEMHRRFYKDGYRIYRFDVESKKDYINPENEHFKFVQRIKNALDPNRILSPGRYEAN